MWYYKYKGSTYKDFTWGTWLGHYLELKFISPKTRWTLFTYLGWFTQVWTFFIAAALLTGLGLRLLLLKRQQAAAGQTVNERQNSVALKRTIALFLVDALAYSCNLIGVFYEDSIRTPNLDYGSSDIAVVDRALTTRARLRDLKCANELLMGLYSLNLIILLVASRSYRRMAAKTASKWRITKAAKELWNRLGPASATVQSLH